MATLNRRNLERLIVILLSLAVMAPFLSSALRLEYSLLHFRFGITRGGTQDELLQDITVILADTKSEERIGRPFDSTWREFYPSLLDTLTEAGARVIIWDFAFAASEPEYDAALAAALRRSVPVVAGEEPASATTPSLRDAFTEIGWLAMDGSDAMARLVPGGTEIVPLSWIAAAYLREGAAQTGAIDPGLPPSQDTWIDYSHDVGQIASVSLADVLLSDGTRLANDLRTPLSVFKDRVVFIGLNLPATDRYPLPGTGGARVPGVYSQISAALTFARDSRIVKLGGLLNLLICGAASIALTLLWTVSNRYVRQFATVGLAALGLLLPIVLFMWWRVWISYSAMIVGIAVPLVVVGILRRRWLTKSYRTSLGFDPELIERHKDLIESYATGVEREACVLCSDVRNYTQFVTDHDPDKVQKVMSEYMAAMETIVDTHGGYVNKYVGDEIVAVFGFPRNEKDVVNRAVRAALHMLERLDELNDEWSSEGYPPLDAVGIGLDVGPLRFTHIGGRHRVQFDIIGNPINGASRLQMLTKEHRRPLILPAEMVELQDELDVAMYGAEPESQGRRSVTFIGEVMVRGQGRRRVYGLLT